LTPAEGYFSGGHELDEGQFQKKTKDESGSKKTSYLSSGMWDESGSKNANRIRVASADSSLR
jgi:hypothetical protein